MTRTMTTEKMMIDWAVKIIEGLAVLVFGITIILMVWLGDYG